MVHCQASDTRFQFKGNFEVTCANDGCFLIFKSLVNIKLVKNAKIIDSYICRIIFINLMHEVEWIRSWLHA